MIPNSLWSAAISATAKLVALFIATLEPWRSNIRAIETADLALGLGTSQRTIQRALLELRGKVLEEVSPGEFRFIAPYTD